MHSHRSQTRFQARTTLERKFLTSVNAVYGKLAPLAGMTSAAIDAWTRRAIKQFPDRPVAKVAAVLREVAKRAELLADDSRDVFNDTELASAGTSDDLQAMILQALGSDPTVEVAG